MTTGTTRKIEDTGPAISKKNTFVSLDLRSVDTESNGDHTIDAHLKITCEPLPVGKNQIGLRQLRIRGLLDGCEMLPSAQPEEGIDYTADTGGSTQSKEVLVEMGKGAAKLMSKRGTTKGDSRRSFSSSHTHSVEFAVGKRPEWIEKPKIDETLVAGDRAKRIRLQIDPELSAPSGAFSSDVRDDLDVCDEHGNIVNSIAKKWIIYTVLKRNGVTAHNVRVAFRIHNPEPQ